MSLAKAARPNAAGRPERVPPRAAALANGAISHALDYDDTHFAHVGHPSVGVLPAALALGEARGASAPAVLDAFLIGAEASIRIGLVLGRAHYERGFHQTATAGAFGATVAAAHVLGLSREATRQALSLVSTRASGLKSQFGSMGKPFNAGVAASNGVEAAELAELGFLFPQFPYVAHSRGWSREDMERNVEIVRNSGELAEGAQMLAKRCLELSADLLAHVEARKSIERGGRKAHGMEG